MNKEAIFLSFGSYILSSSVIHASCGSELSLWQLQLILVRGLLQGVGEGCLDLRPQGKEDKPHPPDTDYFPK
jgi:hypothetical protein